MRWFLIVQLMEGNYWYWNRDTWSWHPAEVNASRYTQAERNILSLPTGGEWVKARP